MIRPPSAEVCLAPSDERLALASSTERDAASTLGWGGHPRRAQGASVGASMWWLMCLAPRGASSCEGACRCSPARPNGHVWVVPSSYADAVVSGATPVAPRFRS